MRKGITVAQTLVWLLVAGSANAESARFVRTTSGDLVVTDRVTGLQWQGCPIGLSGLDCETGTGAGAFSWEQALKQCEALKWGGLEDWRLPNRKELLSIVDPRVEGNSYVAKISSFFPKTPAGRFWSSSSKAYVPTYAWSVDFGKGFVKDYGKTAVYSVRCVRGGP